MRFREFVDTTGLTKPAAAETPDAQAPALAGAAKGMGNPAAAGGHETTIKHTGARVLDARISVVGFEKAYDAMKRACAQILSDESATVQKWSDETNSHEGMAPWRELFVMARNSPARGYIEIEHKPQQGRGVVGDMGFTAGWMTKKWTNALRLPFEKMGVVTNPEEVYRNAFESELLRLSNQPDFGNNPVLKGLDEWEVSTSTFGRNIIIKPSGRVAKEWATYRESGPILPAAKPSKPSLGLGINPMKTLLRKIELKTDELGRDSRNTGEGGNGGVPDHFLSWPQVIRFFNLTPEELAEARRLKVFFDDGMGVIKIHPRGWEVLKKELGKPGIFDGGAAMSSGFTG